MELSEKEQRVLEQIENGLSQEHPTLVAAFKKPHFGKNPTTAAPRPRRTFRIMGAFAALIAGMLMLLVGVAMSWTAVGVLGFTVMLAGCIILPLDRYEGAVKARRRVFIRR